MRIIAGRFRSRRLKGPGALPVRPTSDRLRQTLFDILGRRIEGAIFIDAFAGTGAVGLEALSRGAARVLFVEISRRAADVIAANLNRLAAYAAAEVLVGDARRILRRLARAGVQADFLFLDPPYAAATDYCRLLQELADALPLAPTGSLIVEHPARIRLPACVGGIELWRTVSQGDAALSFYQRLPGPQAQPPASRPAAV
jgi:16S rRNA (guanine966-N2)-methyltransferase